MEYIELSEQFLMMLIRYVHGNENLDLKCKQLKNIWNNFLNADPRFRWS